MVSCPYCQKPLKVILDYPDTLERVAAGASLNLPSSGAPQTPPILKGKEAEAFLKDAAKPATEMQRKTVEEALKRFPQTPIPLGSITDQKLSDDLDALPWVWNSKHTGHLTDWLTIAQQTRAALATRMTPEKNETWRYGQYSYNRFRTDKGGELLCRFSVKVTAAKKEVA